MVPGGGAARSLLLTPRCPGEAQFPHLDAAKVRLASSGIEERTRGSEGVSGQADFMRPLVGRTAGQHTHRAASL